MMHRTIQKLSRCVTEKVTRHDDDRGRYQEVIIGSYFRVVTKELRVDGIVVQRTSMVRSTDHSGKRHVDHLVLKNGGAQCYWKG